MFVTTKTALEELGYAHATTGNRTACPTRIANPDYRRGFLAGWAA